MPLTKKEVIEFIKGLPTPELSALILELQEELGVTPAPPQPTFVTAGAPTTMGAPLEEEEHELTLREVGPNRLEVIKALRALTGKGLADCKSILEGLPRKLLEDTSKEEAREWERQLTASGAIVERKSR